MFGGRKLNNFVQNSCALHALSSFFGHKWVWSHNTWSTNRRRKMEGRLSTLLPPELSHTTFITKPWYFLPMSDILSVLRSGRTFRSSTWEQSWTLAFKSCKIAILSRNFAEETLKTLSQDLETVSAVLVGAVHHTILVLACSGHPWTRSPTKGNLVIKLN